MSSQLGISSQYRRKTEKACQKMMRQLWTRRAGTRNRNTKSRPRMKHGKLHGQKMWFIVSLYPQCRAEARWKFGFSRENGKKEKATSIFLPQSSEDAHDTCTISITQPYAQGSAFDNPGNLPPLLEDRGRRCTWHKCLIGCARDVGLKWVRGGELVRCFTNFGHKTRLLADTAFWGLYCTEYVRI